MNFKKYFEKQNIKLTDKEKITIKVSGLITAARLYSNLSQKQLAEKIGTQQPSVARAEKGEMIASIEFLDKIARAVNTELILYFGFMDQTRKTDIVNMNVNNDYKLFLSPIRLLPTWDIKNYQL